MLEHAIETYGYLVIFLGTFLEGETILVIGGFVAHRGYVSLAGVILAAFAGSLLGDNLFFYLGRCHGERYLARHPGWGAKLQRARSALDRNRTMITLSFRFLYGLRTVTPFALGMTNIPLPRFLLLNAAGAALWATGVALLGYLFGELAQRLLDKVEHYEMVIIILLAAGGLCLWGLRTLRRRRKR